MAISRSARVIYLCLVISSAHASPVKLSDAAGATYIVNTQQGEVQGALAPDGDYYVFYGIPYAGSVSGENRFKAAPPPPSFSGVFQAVNNTVTCARPSSSIYSEPFGIEGHEDCLVLNIHTKNMTTPKPVMVVLLGDEYSSIDYKSYSYTRLVESDVVVVTLNYRLSIFGFLCLGVPEAPGNAGLKDVVQGLTWIKNNIAGFGGDPDNVVLFGHGSGAAMVDLITLSPLGSNLVHKAVTQSGSAFAPWAVAYEPVKYARRFAERLNYTGGTVEELASKLVTTDLDVLGPQLIVAILLQHTNIYNNSVLFAPCIENNALENGFLTEAPIDIIQSSDYSHIPYIAGYTDREGTIRTDQALYNPNNWLQRMEWSFHDFVPVDLAFNPRSNNVQLANEIRNFYWENRTINMTSIRDYLDYHGDTTIAVPVIRGARERATTSRADVFLLEFTYRGTLNSDWTSNQIPKDGVGYGGFLNYLFNYDLKNVDEPIMNSIVRRYVSFMHTGVPTNGGNNWLPIGQSSPPDFNYLHYGGNSDTVVVTWREAPLKNPHSSNLTFWDGLYDEYYIRPPIVSSAGQIISFALVIAAAQVMLAYL